MSAGATLEQGRSRGHSDPMPRFIVIALLLLLASCSTTQFVVANAPTAFDRVDRHADLPYGEDPRQRLDVYSPRQATNRPVVIFWYGGSWVKGRKSNYRFVGTTLAERGFVAVLPDYRLYPQVSFRRSTRMGREQWPGSSSMCGSWEAIRITSC
jgi:acetyl esterase/lipase